MKNMNNKENHELKRLLKKAIYNYRLDNLTHSEWEDLQKLILRDDEIRQNSSPFMSKVFLDKEKADAYKKLACFAVGVMLTQTR